MRTFTYYRPFDLKQAAALMSNATDARFLAGGQSLIPALKQRLAAPAEIIDLRAISKLKGITVGRDVLTIGAMTRHAEVAASPEVREAIPALADLAGGIGDRQVRNMG